MIRPPVFAPRPDMATDPHFMAATLSVAQVMASYRGSLFAFECLTPDGTVKDIAALSPGLADEYRTASQALDHGAPVLMPILGWGMLDCVEIGAGRAAMMVLYARGMQTVRAYIPVSAEKMMKNMMAADPKSERGNVMIYILLAVVLLAALSFAVSSSTRTGSTTALTDGQARTGAAEILTYANHLKTAAAKLNLRGCTATQLSFENPVVSGYTNGSAPANKTCHVFDPAGGAISWVTPDASLNNGTPWFYTGDAVVHNNSGVLSGSSAAEADLVMLLFGLPQNLCTQINARLGITGIPDNSDSPIEDIDKFTGSFSVGLHINGLPEASWPSPCSNPSTPINLCGRDAGCLFDVNGSSEYVFFQMLLAR
jgi:hypothetical protein